MAPKRSQKAMTSLETTLPRPGHKRAKIEDPVADKVTALTEGLANPELVEIEGSLVCREMFVTIMPLALKLPRSERHGYQASVASMIGDILNSSKDKWEQKVNDAQIALDSINAEKSAAVSARDEATLRVKEQEAVVANAKDQVKQHAEAEVQAQQVLAKATKEVSEFEDVQAEKAKRLEGYNALYNENFKAVESPSEPLSAKDQKTHSSKLTAFLKEVKADKSLVTAFEAVIKKMPADRGTFDSYAVEQVGELLKNSSNALQTDLDSSDSLKAQKIEAQTQAQQALDSAKENHQVQKDNLKAATEVLTSLSDASKAALKLQVSKNSEANNSSNQHAEQQKGLEKVQNLVSMFEFLVERDVVPEPEPETKVDATMADAKVDAMMEDAPAMVEPVQAMQEVA
eukprot:gnl/MRDRNA2_/MRDRNA2_88723_c0_seq1.p1 gnl/MRDRNA2_/MRDRNA2_88723_c0~~gnl/MRDRNA2_/MRDRNA2_88723_c0_seq1.p1  ORF type:complete len:426 (+),score=129.85 gnl/MRDRNA2_/MRDRNA2_88723_c0_seq1:78-1280(+)